MRTIEHWINGSATPAGSTRTAPVYDPARGTQQAAVLLAEAADVDTAVAAAAKAFQSWQNSSLSQRMRIMFAFRELLVRHEDELARLVSSEHGKVIDDARGEIVRGREVVEYACGIAEVLKGELLRPGGAGRGRALAAAAAGRVRRDHPVQLPGDGADAGCTRSPSPPAIPSSSSPASATRRRPTSSPGCMPRRACPTACSTWCTATRSRWTRSCEHPDIAAVSFVGSTPIARYVHGKASAAGKRVQALGGAKNHAIVLPDADLDYAASHLTAAAYGSAGERCMAISVAVAVGDAGDSLVEALGRKAAAVRVGPGDDPASEMGPLVTAEARQRVANYIAAGARQGAEVVVDGRGLTVPGYEDGFFVGPTLIDQVTPAMDVYTDEIFGPVLVRGPRGHRGRGHQAGQRQPLRQRHGDLHLRRRVRPPVRPRGQRRHGRRQRADPGAGVLLLVRRLEGLAVRRQPHPRPGRGPLLHPGEGRDQPLAARRPPRRVAFQLPHARAETPALHDTRPGVPDGTSTAGSRSSGRVPGSP